VLLYNRGSELMQPVATHGPVEHTSVIVLEGLHVGKSKHQIIHLRHGVLRLHSLGEVVIIGEWVLLLLCACMLFC
jgi:hypothetical protein